MRPGDRQSWGRGSATSFGGPRQIHLLQPITPVYFTGGEGATGTVDFRVDVPDSRLRVRIDVIGVPAPGGRVDFLSTKVVSLWLRAVSDSQQDGWAVNVTNLFATQAAPLTIPQDAGLGGYSREFVTAADAIQGTLTIADGDNNPGKLIVQARYQPDAGADFENWEEWTRFAGRPACS
jgi:hypothetical protein